jgi:hypothetical protein
MELVPPTASVQGKSIAIVSQQEVKRHSWRIRDFPRPDGLFHLLYLPPVLLVEQSSISTCAPKRSILFKKPLNNWKKHACLWYDALGSSKYPVRIFVQLFLPSFSLRSQVSFYSSHIVFVGNKQSIPQPSGKLLLQCVILRDPDHIHQMEDILQHSGRKLLHSTRR